MRSSDDDGLQRAGPIRVLIVDDHQAVAEALGVTIDLQDGMKWVGASTSVEGGLTRCAEEQPDVVLMDVDLPEVDGIEGTRMIKRRFPDIHVLIVSGYTDASLVSKGAQAGAVGFVPKQTPVAEIIRAIRTASEGEMLVPASMLSAVLLQESSEKKADDEHDLTEREFEVLTLLGQGLDARTIANQLDIQISTSRGHIKGVLRKLGAHSQLEAVVTATRRGILSPSSLHPATDELR